MSSAYTQLAGLLTFRPLSEPLDPPGYSGSYNSPFSASWSDTVDLLARELRHLEPTRALLEVALPESKIRLDGLPRADARAASPGVILTLIGTTQGDLRYPASWFHTWQDNVRALALALEALRKVDRYGVTKRGEQYAGWKQLAAPGADRAAELIRRHGSKRAALKATHPDAGGDPEDFIAVQGAPDA